MDDKGKSFDFRNKQWQSLCDKYEKRGNLNPTDCSFSEVNYKLFAKPWFVKSKRNRRKRVLKKVQTENVNVDNSSCNTAHNGTEKTLDIDISDIIDDDVYETLPKPKNIMDCKVVLTDALAFNKNVTKVPIDCSLVKRKISEDKKTTLSETHRSNITDNNRPEAVPKKSNRYPMDKENRVAATQNSLDDLVHFVEVILESTLKQMITIRSECKILESDEYDHWHICTKNEMKRLRKYITREELKDYMRHCNRGDFDLSLLKDKISNCGASVKNDLKDLLIKREFARHDQEKYLKYCHKVYAEWQKLTQEIPVDHLIMYASGVMNSIRQGKHTYSMSDKYQMATRLSIEPSKESVDSGFVSVQS